MLIEKHKHQDYRHNPFTLWFKDRRLEHNFRASHMKKTLQQVRLALVLGAIIYSVFSALDFIVLKQVTNEALIVRFAFAIPAFIVGLSLSYVDYFKKKLQLLVSILVFVAGLGVAIISVIYQEATSELYLAGTLIPIFWAFLFSGLRFVAAYITCFTLILAYEIIIYYFSNYSLTAFISYNFFLFSITLIGMFGGYTIERQYRKDFINTRIIDEKRRENERLLLNILPPDIALELKNNPGTIAKRYEKATVLFADLVGFTQFSAGRSPKEVVDILNCIFSSFDELTDKYKLEKIKTVGDAYMVAGGLTNDPNDGLKNIIRFTLEAKEKLQQYNQESGQNIKIRMGIHSGPVIAGVIGTKKFIYDIWGETVNIASRMETTSLPDHIQISPAVEENIRDSFEIAERGLIDIKGMGEMQTYWLLDHKTTEEDLQLPPIINN